MIVSLPTPLGPEMMTSMGARRALDRGRRVAGLDPSTIRRSTGRTPRAKPVEHRLELGGQRRRRPDEVPVGRRGQLEPPGVEEEPVEPVRARAATSPVP